MRTSSARSGIRRSDSSESCSRATVAAGGARVGAAWDERAQPAGPKTKVTASANGKHNSREVIAPFNYKNDAARRLTPAADLRARNWGVEDADGEKQRG